MGYEEGPILFRPTYRYNLNSDEYDTGEKMRIPAWTGDGLYIDTPLRVSHSPTDRILYRGQNLDLEKYFRAELKSSDHRPVYAVSAFAFMCDANTLTQRHSSSEQKYAS